MGRHAHGSGRIPRPQRPHRGSHDRGTGNGRRRGGTTRDLSDRDFAQRRNGRAPRPFAVHHGLLRGMGGVRLGHRHLHRPSDSLRKTRLGSRTAAPHGRTAHPRPAVLHSRRDDDNRPHLHRGDLARRAHWRTGPSGRVCSPLRASRRWPSSEAISGNIKYSSHPKRWTPTASRSTRCSQPHGR